MFHHEILTPGEQCTRERKKPERNPAVSPFVFETRRAVNEAQLPLEFATGGGSRHPFHPVSLSLSLRLSPPFPNHLTHLSLSPSLSVQSPYIGGGVWTADHTESRTVITLGEGEYGYLRLPAGLKPYGVSFRPLYLVFLRFIIQPSVFQTPANAGDRVAGV